MPLSDEEARLLAQLEQSLAEEDPEFASTLRGSKLAARYRKIAALAVIGFVAGMAMLLAGAVTATTWLGVIGFVAMVGAAYSFIRTWRRGMIGGEAEPRSQAPQSKGPSSFVDRMEERWNRRQDDGR